MTDPDYAKIWSEACNAYEDAGVQGNSTRENVLAGDAAASGILKERLEAEIKNLSERAAKAEALQTALTKSQEENSRLSAEILKLKEILRFDCTSFPGMEEAAIRWANKISGAKGEEPYHPDPVGILEMCEEIANSATT